MKVTKATNPTTRRPNRHSSEMYSLGGAGGGNPNIVGNEVVFLFLINHWDTGTLYC